MTNKLSFEQLNSIVFDKNGEQLYPECHLMNGSQVLVTVKLFSFAYTNSNVCYAYELPEDDIRMHWIVQDIFLENNKLFATSYRRV
jgi:hypothetical protein